ncbi:sensor histidine kinase [Specibacter cremeus]|uniref:sensor histidine kinase n=1 Tax=Specibacter cremeus TaxID=1629051 RepID=UPI000F77904A|nr:histidine kinase [Specibacter cremeus]
MHSIYDWFRRHRFAVDFTAMAVLWLLFVGLGTAGGAGLRGVAFDTVLLAPLAWRRTRTVPSGVVIAAACIVQWSLSVPPSPANVAVPLTVYALAAYAPRWASLGGLVLALGGGVMLVTRYFTTVTGEPVASLPISFVLLVLVWVLVLFSWTAGDLTRTKRLREQALEDRAHRLEIEQQQERELAAGDERAHIAREMHDIVAHSLSVIITQADGARYAAAADPAVAPAALATIADTGRTSLREMRRLLGVLRGDEAASTRPLPGLGDLDELLLGTRAAGLTVSYAVTGEPRRTLPAGAELTAYRVVQESLTNVIKHGGPKVVASVVLDWTGRGLQITVTDDGRGAAASTITRGTLPSGGGNGLRGMAERVKLYDGTLDAKPRAGGGFVVLAFIPYTET